MVNSCNAEHFIESDIPIMLGFCQAFVQQQRAMDEMKKHPLFIMSDNGKVAQHPLVAVHKSLSGTVSNYAMRLRITPSTRIETKQAAVGSKAPPGLEDDPVDALFAQPLDG
jgi:P27 family predicted phage terminase small subunit